MLLITQSCVSGRLRGQTPGERRTTQDWVAQATNCTICASVRYFFQVQRKPRAARR